MEEFQDKAMNQHEKIIKDAKLAHENSFWNVSLILILITILVVPFFLPWPLTDVFLFLTPLVLIISLITIFVSRQAIRKIRAAEEINRQSFPGVRLNQVYIGVAIFILILCIVVIVLALFTILFMLYSGL